jgi:hypothetical protein
MTKAAQNLIPGGALVWEDVEHCTKCGQAADVSATGEETEEGEPELLCWDCGESK